MPNAQPDTSALYENSPCGCLSFTAEGSILQVNRTLLQWLGYSKDDVLSRKRFSDLLTVGGKLYYHMVLLPLLSRQGEVSEMNFDVLTADGGFFPCLFNANQTAENGEIMINAVILKINDRKKLEADLQKARRIAEEEKRRIETLSNVIPNPVYTMATAGDITFANQRFYEEFPFLKPGFNRKELRAGVHPLYRKLIIKEWNKAIEKTIPFEVEIRFKNRSSKYCWYLIRTMPYVDYNGKVDTWFGSFTNIHTQKTKQLRELKMLKVNLTEANDTISVKERALNEISYSQSHIVRRPLANIIGLLGLSDEDPDYTANIIMPMIKQSANELDLIIKSMIDA